MKISRDPEAMASERFDLVVIGGGIVGVCTLLEASRRGLKTLLIEAEDFGGATSWNSLRIIHGGLRYLQNLDIGRFRRSVGEQAWWMQHFPDLIEPLPCAMPLYNSGLKRTQIMRLALKLNDAMAESIRRPILGVNPWEKSKILTADQTRAFFPSVRSQQLQGAALWQDARMTSPQRLIIELLRWSMAAGGNALNYMRCVGFEELGEQISAVRASCGVSNREFQFETKHVINCCGPWWKNVATLAGPSTPKNHAAECALAFNVVIERKPLSDIGLAVSAPRPNAATYFILPLEDRMLVGTEHLAPQDDPHPSEMQIEALLNEINCAIPGIDLRMDDVSQVLVGRLPPSVEGSPIPSKSEKIVGAGQSGGLLNLTSVESPKYTTARYVAESALRYAERTGTIKLKELSNVTRPQRFGVRKIDIGDFSASMVRDLQLWMEEESVIHLDDLLLRRCEVEPVKQLTIGRKLADNLVWPGTADEQIQRLVGAQLKHH